ncbi:cytochrome P450 [Primorskyibacter sp. S187A]|uniref:cytochrome P450 n=1 Tax=Primorskyibacter sp. S187A TaxID=3415130 RepID=UPI003C7CF93F
MPDTTLPQTALPVRADLVTKPMTLLQSLSAARNNLLQILPEIATRQPMVSGKTGTRWHMVMDPPSIKRIVLERLDDYPKSKVTKNLLRPAIGDSLFIAEGAHWRWQRRAAAPVFTHRNIMNLAPMMTGAAARCAERIENAGPRAVNLFDEMVTTTFDVISDVTFSGDEGFDRQSVHTAIDAYIDQAGRISLFDVLGFPDWVPRPGRMIVGGTGLKDMKAIADQTIEARAKRGTEGVPDLLDLLLSGEDPETKRSMTTSEVRDNLLAFIVAGHETTALALSWALYLCAFDQDVQDRARAELQGVIKDGVVRGEDVAQLPLIRAIVDEALRLYPPAGIVSRTAQVADELCGREIRPGDTVMIPIYALHRHHMLWEEPDAFRPDRWLTGKKPDRYSYFPFGDGPRICIGASFALTEAVIILGTLLARHKFTPVPGRTPEPVMILTLRPDGGVWLEAEPV